MLRRRFAGLAGGAGDRVTSKRDKTWLHLQGFFGKGILSRSELTYEETVRMSAYMNLGALPCMM